MRVQTAQVEHKNLVLYHSTMIICKDFYKLRALNTSGTFAQQIFDTGKVTIG
jgi:hypothetical protein